MRVLLLDRDNSYILSVIESVYFDSFASELQLYEFGSTEADYVFIMNEIDAVRVINSMFENGFCDLCHFRVEESVFDDE